MSLYYEKYLKYKQKYHELKMKLDSEGGSGKARKAPDENNDNPSSKRSLITPPPSLTLQASTSSPLLPSLQASTSSPLQAPTYPIEFDPDPERTLVNYQYFSPENQEKSERFFNSCVVNPVHELTLSQAFYEAYMNVGPCYIAKEFNNYKDHILERMCGLVDIKKQEGVEVKHILNKIGETLVILLGACVLHLYSARDALLEKSEKPFSGNLPYTFDDINRYKKLLVNPNKFFMTRKVQLETILSTSGYPKIQEILASDLSEYDLTVTTTYINPNIGNALVSNKLLSKSIGKYQYLHLKLHNLYDSSGNPVLDENGRHKNVNVLYFLHPENPSFYYNEIGTLYCSFLSNNKPETKGEAREIAFRLYYLFVNIVPYSRGSAGAGKVLLNTLLYMSGNQLVKEKIEYTRQADWVAFSCKTPEEFLGKVPEIFEPI
jgi:hypothetical protein